MRASWMLWAALLCGTAHADLFTAQTAYRNGDYDRAFKDYRELAELGQPLAQHNVAIMYAQGKGVRQSELNAFAWATLAVENGDLSAQSLVEQLRPQLAPGSEKIAAEIGAPFRRSALDELLMPKIEDDPLAETRCRITKSANVDYPAEAQRTGLQGSVFVEMAVMPDGTTRTPRILYAMPSRVFEASVREAGLHFRYRADLADHPVRCRLMVRFIAQHEGAESYPQLQSYVSATQKKAESGDVAAEYLYGLMLAGLPQLGYRQSSASPWFLKAAQAGLRDAQYMVGARLLSGVGCHCEENKALLWLRKAAEADESHAQVTLASYALRAGSDPANLRVARLWLERAAASGDHDGAYYLAALLAAAPEADMRDPKRALTLLDQVHAAVSADPTSYEIRAAAQAASGSPADAAASEREAIARAKRLQWSLTPLNERLARYESRQAWYGNLLEQ
jgi:TonB family protein